MKRPKLIRDTLIRGYDHILSFEHEQTDFRKQHEIEPKQEHYLIRGSSKLYFHFPSDEPVDNETREWLGTVIAYIVGASFDDCYASNRDRCNYANKKMEDS